MGAFEKGYHYIAAGYGSYGYEPNIVNLLGFPVSIEAGKIVMDIPFLTINMVDSIDADKSGAYNGRVGILSSALEHTVPEQFYSIDPQNLPEAISSVKAISMAEDQGQQIYLITQSNQFTVLPNIHHDQDTILEITNALSIGKEVITHTDAVSIPGWSGAGYIIRDPITQDGAYKISGGTNGGQIGLGLGTALGLAVSSIIKTQGESLAGLKKLVFSSGMALALSFITGFLGGLILLDKYQGQGKTAGCFLIGLVTGFELGLVLGDLFGSGTKAGSIRNKIMEVVFAIANITVDEYGSLPKRTECGVFP